MLKPHIRVASVHEVTPELLSVLGLKGVLVDVDDTLLAARDEHVDDSVYAWFDFLAASSVPVVILSNGSRDRVRAIAARAGVPGLHLAGKPFAWAFRRGLELLNGVTAAETAMVGDQLFTDILGAKRAGLTTILVRPLSPGKLPHTRMVRRLERMVLKER